MFDGQLDPAGVHIERAVGLNPTDTRIISIRALWSAFMGKSEEALENIELALRRDPFTPGSHWTFLATTLFQAGRYQDTINAVNSSDATHALGSLLPGRCTPRDIDIHPSHRRLRPAG